MYVFMTLCTVITIFHEWGFLTSEHVLTGQMIYLYFEGEERGRGSLRTKQRRILPHSSECI